MFPSKWIRWAARLAPLFIPLLAAGPLRAQGAARLTLEEAIALARRSNPGLLAARNDEAEADWRAREAYAALLPTASADLGLQYQASGEPRVGLLTGADLGLGETPAYYFSDYSLGVAWRLDGGTVFRARQARLGRASVRAEVEAAEFELRESVTRQYLAVLRARDALELARRERAGANENLALAGARLRVGAATELETKQAEVERGRTEVALLRAETLLRTETLRLAAQLGIGLERAIEPASTFAVFDPPWSEEELVRDAAVRHPRLRSLRAAEAAAGAGVRAARGAFLPTLQLSVGWSGYTRQAGDDDYLLRQARDQARGRIESCELFNRISAGLSSPLPDRPADCASLALTPAREQAILEGNDVFPFRFSRQPLGASLRVSVPLFQGFSRQRQLETARAARDDAHHRRREQELRSAADIAAALANLRAAYRAVGLEERNAALAGEQLALARERYRLGAGSFLELTEAETQKARAARDHLDAVYTFHETLAALESAVGHPLPPPAEPR